MSSGEVTRFFVKDDKIKSSCPLYAAVQPQTDLVSCLYLDRFYPGHYPHKKPFCAISCEIFNKKMTVKLKH